MTTSCAGQAKDFVADILNFAKEEATKEDIDYLKSEVKEKIETQKHEKMTIKKRII